jgi:c-di-GMP-binding flagellar brake protein YcgR
MQSLPLTRRKTQLDLLSAACGCRQRAHVAQPATDAAGPTVNTRFLALESDGLLLEWPAGSDASRMVEGETVEVSWEHQGERYTFRTQSIGQVWWNCPRRGDIPVWKLGLPLRVQAKQRRTHCRVSLSDLDPIPVRFTSTADSHAAFVARLVNVSPGGLGALAAADEYPDVSVGDLHWAEFELPGQPGRFEFVVRCVHANALSPGGATVVGCAFCPTDDASAHSRQLERIQDFVLSRQYARRRREHAYCAGGD